MRSAQAHPAGTDEVIDVSLALVADRSRIATGVAIRDAARLRLTALAQAGAFEVKASRRFPLAQAAEAHRLLAKGGGGGGHVVLIP